MMTLTHAIVGAGTGRLVANIPLVIIIGIMLHLAMDKVPHFLPQEKKKLYTVCIIDALLTIAFMISLFLSNPVNKDVILAGALTQVGIDFFLVLTPLLKTRVGSWHLMRQEHRTTPYYYAIDLLTSAILLILWWKVK